MARYGLPNKDKTGIVNWYNTDNGGLIVHPIKKNIVNPSNTQLIEAGYYLWVEPEVLQYQNKAGYVFGTDTFSRSVTDWSQEEIDEDVDRIAAQEILAFKKDSQYILALVGKDDEWINSKIDSTTGGETNAEIVENIRTALKEISYTQRDLANIITALYKLGRI